MNQVAGGLGVCMRHTTLIIRRGAMSFGRALLIVPTVQMLHELTLQVLPGWHRGIRCAEVVKLAALS